jgi:hypothetical protein
VSGEAYVQSLRAIEQVIADETESDEILRRAVDLLHDGFDSYSWVGVYFVEGEELALGPWNGPEATEHVRIPIGEGVCGSAAASGQTEIVDDVNADSWPASHRPGRKSWCQSATTGWSWPRSTSTPTGRPRSATATAPSWSAWPSCSAPTAWWAGTRAANRGNRSAYDSTQAASRTSAGAFSQ